MKEHYLLVEKYRPDTLEGFIATDEMTSKIDGWIKEQTIPNLGFFSAKPGCGKTTLAKILVKNIDCDYLYLNATDNRSMDDIKEKILPFISTMSFKTGPKIVILDEATHILQAAQVLLLNMIETYSKNARFILTGNYPERLIEPLRSRLEIHELKVPSKKVLGNHVYKILKQENIKFDNNDLFQIINSCYPDIRATLNTCQKHIQNGVLENITKLSNKNDGEDQIIEILKKPTKSSFNDIRKTIAEEELDVEDLYKVLYDRVDEYGKSNVGQAVIIINEHLYQNNFVLDKEICFCACIAKLLDILKPQQINS